MALLDYWGYEIAKTTALMAELHGTARMNFTRDVLAVNVGLRHQFTESRILIVSLGHEVSRSGPTTFVYRLLRPAVALLSGVFFGFIQCALEAGFCGKIRIKATITTSSACEAV
jgi:hypothetical protein